MYYIESRINLCTELSGKLSDFRIYRGTSLWVQMDSGSSSASTEYLLRVSGKATRQSILEPSFEHNPAVEDKKNALSLTCIPNLCYI